jgi:alkylation response protein AidB-like acyl-CoA dehydrogenase
MTKLAPEAAALLDRVREAVPALAADAAEAERHRRPTDAQIRAMEEAGVFRMMVPRAHGGLELDLDAFLEVGLALAEADVSIAWVTSFCIEHNWMLCQFPEAFQKELYAEADWILAPGVVAPTGQAAREDGGYRLSGRWSWGTGVMHSSWVIVGTLVAGEELSPDAMLFTALPMDDVRIEDVWHVDGMCGTGSNDIVVEGAFVPAERTVRIADMVNGQAHGATLHEGPLYRTPMIPILMLAASMPLVGRAVWAARSFGEYLKGKMRINAMGTPSSEKPAAQIRLADATLEAAQAEHTLRSVAADVMRLRNEATVLDRSRWAASITHAVHQARRVLQDVAEASGGSAHFLHHPLQRALRDVSTASAHVAFDHDAQRELYGRLLLGLEPTVGLF